MDLWDVTKLMWRRWYVTAPMLLVTFAAALWINAAVGPEYQATGHVAVVPPQELRQAEAGEVNRVNPWNEEALGDAARIRLEAKRLEDEMAAEGFAGAWSVDVTGRLPVLEIQVVAPTAEQAVETMHRLQEVVEDEVRDRQSEYELAGGELYSTVRYDQGESVETTASRLRRALVAVVAAGLILTAGVVIAYDAIARWRHSRNQPDPATPPAAPASATDDEHRPRYTYGSGSESTAQPAMAVNGGSTVPSQASRLTRLGSEAHPANETRVTSQPVSPAPAMAAHNGESRYAQLRREYLGDDHSDQGRVDRDSGERGREKSEPPVPAGTPGEHATAATQASAQDAGREPYAQPAREPDDATVVLPLSNAPWAGRRHHDWPSSGQETGGTGTH